MSCSVLMLSLPRLVALDRMYLHMSMLLLLLMAALVTSQQVEQFRQIYEQRNYQVPSPSAKQHHADLAQHRGDGLEQLENNRSIYTSLNKILYQIKSQLERSKHQIDASRRMDSDGDEHHSPTKAANIHDSSEHKSNQSAKTTSSSNTVHTPNSLNETLRGTSTSGGNRQQSAARNQANESVTTLEIDSQPVTNLQAGFVESTKKSQPFNEASDSTARFSTSQIASSRLPTKSHKSLISSATTTLPVHYSARMILPATLPPRSMKVVAEAAPTTRRSSLASVAQDEDEPLEDEDESDGSSVNTQPAREHWSSGGGSGDSDRSGLFRLTRPSSSKQAFVTSPEIKQTRAKTLPVFLASSVDTRNHLQTPTLDDHGQSLVEANPSHHTTRSSTPAGPYKRRYGQKALNLPSGPSNADYYAQSTSNDLPSTDAEQIDLAGEPEADLRLNVQTAGTKYTTSVDEVASQLSEPALQGDRLPRLSPHSIHLQQVYQPQPVRNIAQRSLPLRQLQDQGYASTRASSHMSSSSGPMATLYGTRDPVTGNTNYHQLSQLPQQQVPQQSTIHSQRDLLNQPQTIQITAVPNGGGGLLGNLGGGGGNPVVRINTLGPNGNLLNNGFNNLWNNGWNNGLLDPFGRQVMMVNAERRQIDWSFWIWPLIAVVTLPMILGALFVPIFLKTIVVLIQILQSLGLLLPLASALSHQIAQASGVAGAASSTSTLTAANNQLENVAQKAVEAQVT